MTAAVIVAVTAVLLVGCLVEVFADPLGIAPALLPVLDQRASVVGAVIAAAGLMVAVIALLVQLRDSRPVQAPPAPPPAPGTTPDVPPGHGTDVGTVNGAGAGADLPCPRGGDRIDIIQDPVTGFVHHSHFSSREIAVVMIAVVAALIIPSLWDWDTGNDDGGGPPSTGAPSKGSPAIVVDVRKADPCSLLDAKALTRFGDTKIDANYGDFDRCDVVVSDEDSDHEVALVKLNFASTPATLDSLTPTKKVGHVTVAEMRGDANGCLRNLQLADGNQIWIEATEIKPSAPDLCALAQAATEHAVTVLNRGPVPERPTPFPANSLAHSNACKLLDAAALAMIPGIDVYDSGFANWECAWESTAADTAVHVSFSQDNDLTDNGRPVRLGGRQSYVTPKEYNDHDCVVRVEHRGYTDAAGEPTIELVVVAVDGPQPVNELCDAAKTLATAVAKKLPKP